MTTPKLFLAALLCSAGAPAIAQQPVPFACNLKAFRAQQRTRWRQLIEQVMRSVVQVRELTDGYALRIDTSQVSLGEAAEWIDLERRCCPFFNFQIDLRGEDANLWLSLKGPEGVKQFIEADFSLLREKLHSRMR